jgi:hypothetical protein
MRKEATAVLCALLAGCSSPHFVKLDASGKVDLSTNPEALKRDLADCQVVEAHARSEAGPLFGRGTARVALDNCMRTKGYLKT